MISAYIIILCLSTFLASWAAARITLRIIAMLHLTLMPPLGLFAVTASILFLTVVGVPAMLLVGAILLVAGSVWVNYRRLPRIAHYGIPLIAVMLGGATLTLPALTTLPPLVLSALLVFMWYVFVLSSRALPPASHTGSLSVIACVVPIMAAPLLFSTPDWLAVDSLILAAAFAGIAIIRPATQSLGVAYPSVALLLFWLQLQTVLHGAWPLALISLLAWGLAIAYATLRPTVSGSHALSL